MIEIDKIIEEISPSIKDENLAEALELLTREISERDKLKKDSDDRYTTLRKQFTERFMYGQKNEGNDVDFNSFEESKDEVVDVEEIMDEKQSKEKVTIDDLFEEREEQ